MTNKIRKAQTQQLIPYEGADQAIDLGSQNITTTGTITATTFVGSGSGGGSVASVNGEVGTVVLDTDDIGEGATNLYYTDERAQDAVGSILTDNSQISFTYNDTTPSITASIQDGSISSGKLASSAVTDAKVSATANISATKIGTGIISNTEFNYLNNVSSNIQDQFTGVTNSLAGKVGTTGDESIAGIKTFTSIPVLPASDPSTANQAVRKSYVDAIANTINPSLYKNACTCATTANITLSGEQTIDGFATSATRVLVKDQSTPSQNGIYISDSGAWTRASDYNTAGEVLQGTSTFILEGTNNANKLFVMNAASVTTLGTDSITFTPISSLSSYDFFTGTTGNDFNIDVSGNDITVNLPIASATKSGKLSSTDWSTFNSKVDGAGTVTDNSFPVFDGTTGKVIDSTGSDLTFDSVTKELTLSQSSSFNFNDGIIYADTDNTFELNSLGVTATIWRNLSHPLGLAGEDYLGISIYNGGLLVGSPSTGHYLPLSAGTSGQALISAGGGAENVWSDIPSFTDIGIFTSSGTWTKPSGSPKTVQVILFGAGGGGGSGRRGATGTIRTGGGGGGSGGYATATFLASVLSPTEAVTIGAGGTGGASRTVNDQNGLAGTNGGTTFFGSVGNVRLRAGGGSGGNGGSTSTASGGSSGQIFPPASSAGSGASSSGTGSIGSSATLSSFGPGAGGAGGGITSANVASTGGVGAGVGTESSAGNSGYGAILNGGTSGSISSNGGGGNNSPTNSGVGGTGGGGGGSSITTNAGSGGNGGYPGGGGGGGGASVNSTGNSGAGGNGGDGLAIVITYF